MPLPSLAHRPVATNFGEGLVPASYKALAAAENIFDRPPPSSDALLHSAQLDRKPGFCE